jgi:hypothetical protein
VPDAWLDGVGREAYVEYLCARLESRRFVADAEEARERANPFSYAVYRLVPRVERGERINVGVVLRGPLDFAARTHLDAARRSRSSPTSTSTPCGHTRRDRADRRRRPGGRPIAALDTTSASTGSSPRRARSSSRPRAHRRLRRPGRAARPALPRARRDLTVVAGEGLDSRHMARFGEHAVWFAFTSDRFDHSSELPPEANAGNRFYGRDVASFVTAGLTERGLDASFFDEDWGWQAHGRRPTRRCSRSSSTTTRMGFASRRTSLGARAVVVTQGTQAGDSALREIQVDADAVSTLEDVFREAGIALRRTAPH